MGAVTEAISGSGSDGVGQIRVNDPWRSAARANRGATGQPFRASNAHCDNQPMPSCLRRADRAVAITSRDATDEGGDGLT